MGNGNATGKKASERSKTAESPTKEEKREADQEKTGLNSLLTPSEKSTGNLIRGGVETHTDMFTEEVCSMWTTCPFFSYLIIQDQM